MSPRSVSTLISQAINCTPGEIYPNRLGKMTAVESQSTPSSFHDTHAESPTSRFTAVNGREPLSGPASSNATNGHNNPRKSSEDRPQAQPRISPPGQEKLTITTTTLQKEDWANPINREKSSNQTGPQFGQPLSYSGAESSHKRKRSGSIDRQASQTVNTHSYHNHAPPASKPEHESRLGRISPDTPYPDAAREASMRTSLQSAPRDPYATPQTDYAQYNEEGRETGSASWYSDQSPEARNTADAQHSALTQNMSPDDQLREALQRENQGTDSRGVYAGTSPGGDHDRGANDRYQGSYGLQADHKKRKRNFSNRTKTGCMTCRRRKKKCDESRPECKRITIFQDQKVTKMSC